MRDDDNKEGFEIEHICSLGFHDIREGVTLRRMIVWMLGCTTKSACALASNSLQIPKSSRPLQPAVVLQMPPVNPSSLGGKPHMLHNKAIY
jgi:hypothetical protein